MSIAYIIVIIGSVVGVLARFIHPGPQHMDWIWTILFGNGGAVVAGWGGRVLGLYEEGQAGRLVSAVIGALVILFVDNRAIDKR